MKRPPLSPLLLALGLLVLAPGCTSVQTLVEFGNYEQAIEVAQRKLTGKQKKNPKYVAALEEAVNRANEADVNRADFMVRSDATDWVRVHDLYDNIMRRQNALRPLLPLIDKNGRKANFRFVRVERLVADAAKQAAEQLYRQGAAQLSAGRKGNKDAARAAYRSFGRIRPYDANYRDAFTLSREAEQLGQVYITLELVNESGAYLPRELADEVLRVRVSELDDQWRTFDTEPRSDRSYDYRARIVLRDIRVSADQLSERSYVDERKITDGEEYVLDERGNVAKDSLGNDITQPRVVVVQAQVLEVLQQKSALVTGRVQLLDLHTGRLLDEDELSAEAVFEHYASTFRGDERALTSDSRRRIGSQPVPFPTNELLIFDALTLLKPQLTDRLASSARRI
ncbi:hypothetical protein LEM8419_01390 [Neolewinella maritima]|uniref:Curli production assembly/transport component CsgG n=1 Tax=Neolewinella maritima TaxID=1383882 RepID=A0ABM9AZL7_9BACT|nr:hypothetical protein [Neolewinella maritima]CAH1000241.1 hypothetical protein LEM8419_01390 [Neolewinella maritima]